MQHRVKSHLTEIAYSLNSIWERNLMRCLIHYPVFFSTSSTPAIISCVYLFCLSLQLCPEGNCTFIFLINKLGLQCISALMFLIKDVYLTHTDISCSRHHNCSFSKPFLNKCREICLQLPNTTTSSEIHGRFWSLVETFGRLLNGSILSAQNCPVPKDLLQVLQILSTVLEINYLLWPQHHSKLLHVSGTQAKLWTISLTGMLKPGSLELFWDILEWQKYYIMQFQYFWGQYILLRLP